MRWLLPLELIEAVALLMVGWAAMRWSMRAEGRLWAAAGDRWLSERLRVNERKREWRESICFFFEGGIDPKRAAENSTNK